MSFEIVQGDLGPSMPLTIEVDDVAVDVSTATSVQLRWLKPDGTYELVTLTEVDATLGEFEYEWQEGDTDQAGVHYGQIVVTTAGIPQSYPRDGTMYIWWINPSLEDA